MGKNLLVYDPNNHLITDFEGEILRQDVVIKTRKQIDKFKEISNKEVDQLTSLQVAGMVRHKYGFQGVRIEENFPVYGGLNKLIDSLQGKVSSPYICKIQTIFLRLSTKQGILKSPKKHCIKWMDLMDVPYLGINSKSEVYRFRKVLTEYDIVRKGPERLVANPLLGYNNTIMFRNTFMAFRDILPMSHLSERYFYLGYDSILRNNNSK